MSPSANLSGECAPFEAQSDKFCMCNGVCEECLSNTIIENNESIENNEKIEKIICINASTQYEETTEWCAGVPFSPFSFNELTLSKFRN